MDDVFSCNVPYGSMMLPRQRCCNVVHKLTPLLDGTGCSS